MKPSTTAVCVCLCVCVCVCVSIVQDWLNKITNWIEVTQYPSDSAVVGHTLIDSLTKIQNNHTIYGQTSFWVGETNLSNKLVDSLGKKTSK